MSGVTTASFSVMPIVVMVKVYVVPDVREGREAVVALVTNVRILDDPTGLYSTEYSQSRKASGPA